MAYSTRKRLYSHTRDSEWIPGTGTTKFVEGRSVLYCLASFSSGKYLLFVSITLYMPLEPLCDVDPASLAYKVNTR
jgi:hypothetical protein